MLADGAGARLADVEPPRDVDLLEVELEERVTRDGLDHAADAASLYGKLEHVILPMFYAERDRYIEVMRHALAINGSFFNTERMLVQYMRKAYFA